MQKGLDVPEPKHVQGSRRPLRRSAPECCMRLWVGGRAARARAKGCRHAPDVRLLSCTSQQFQFHVAQTQASPTSARRPQTLGAQAHFANVGLLAVTSRAFPSGLFMKRSGTLNPSCLAVQEEEMVEEACNIMMSSVLTIMRASSLMFLSCTAEQGFEPCRLKMRIDLTCWNLTCMHL